MRSFLIAATLVLGLASATFAADHLKLNPNLDYTSDSQDGPLITGDHMESGAVSGKPTYVIMYGEACYNSKRQARRTVSLYEKYKGRVQFVVGYWYTGLMSLLQGRFGAASLRTTAHSKPFPVGV